MSSHPAVRMPVTVTWALVPDVVPVSVLRFVLTLVFVRLSGDSRLAVGSNPSAAAGCALIVPATAAAVVVTAPVKTMPMTRRASKRPVPPTPRMEAR